MLQITQKPIGMGTQRMCFVHPEDPRLAIKIPTGGASRQNEREIRFYRNLEKRGGIDCKHIPGFHGRCITNRGPGIVVDLVRDYDGQISSPLNRYLAQGFMIEEFEPFLEELKQSFLKNLIVFDQELKPDSILVQKTSASKFRMVTVGSLGDSRAAGWLAMFPFLLRHKIRRRWQHFLAQVYRSREVRRQREALAGQTAAEPGA